METEFKKRHIGDCFDTPKLKELEQAIASLKAGNGDFAIGDDDDNNILYFWWNHEK